MMDVHKIKPEMPVLGADGQFAVVDHLVGEHTIKLNRDQNGQHHYIPVSWVTSTDDGKVQVSKSGKDAMQEWSTNPTY